MANVAQGWEARDEEGGKLAIISIALIALSFEKTKASLN